MSRLVLQATVATIAFMVGVAANLIVNTLGGVAVDKAYEAIDVRNSTILPAAGSINWPISRCTLVVTVSEDGSLKLNSTPLGKLNDTSLLTESLRTLFEQRDHLHVYVPSPELSAKVPEYRQIEKTVYIKAPRSISYGEVADLIVALRASGADPIGLIADFPNLD